MSRRSVFIAKTSSKDSKPLRKKGGLNSRAVDYEVSFSSFDNSIYCWLQSEHGSREHRRTAGGFAETGRRCECRSARAARSRRCRYNADSAVRQSILHAHVGGGALQHPAEQASQSELAVAFEGSGKWARLVYRLPSVQRHRFF